ncbi:hypothetical protein [Paenibacillus roseipurpureus]|uniref:Uncharacterized protein n=1 Tax=Paenibacillus roseopurpureus TaxID=2918901 RepID=A0AA96LSK3_9BACL|nr:hypothetical protein [Paenibacillus sp. MBLB1832]WNR46499.1 hypothetical protein MJB10_10540 [Paenibacillus sp. MBLB1832]
MIKTQDLKLQMDELTKQNDMVLIELEQVKKMLISSSQGSQSGQNGQANQQSASSDDSNSGKQQSEQSQGQDQNQSQSQHQAQGQSQDQNQDQQSQNSSSNASPSSQNGGNKQVSDLANELLKIKDMVVKLEQKTSQYVSSQSNGSLTEKDTVNLILTLMNGMVDWASEFVSSKANSNGQLQ